jgi:hypothetical protein
MRKARKTELAPEATRPEGADPFGPPRPPTIAELAERGRRFRGEKPLQDAFAAALNDLFDAYLYTLYHPCNISPHELLALINAHRDVMAAQKEARKEALWADIEAKQEALGLEAYRRLLRRRKRKSAL